jgi:hypothetical protein
MLERNVNIGIARLPVLSISERFPNCSYYGIPTRLCNLER